MGQKCQIDGLKKKIFFSIPGHGSDKLCIVLMTKESFNKIVDFMTPGVGVLVPGRGYISHIVKCIMSIKIFLSTLRHDSDKLSDKLSA